jgi:hypothetical protein
MSNTLLSYTLLLQDSYTLAATLVLIDTCDERLLAALRCN